MTPELTALACAALLQWGQVMLAGIVMNRDVGVEYNAGPRDEPADFAPLTGRLRRAVANHFESLTLFTIAVVVVTLSGTANTTTAICAWVYLAARVLYVPAYAYAWSPWRSGFYAIGTAATIIMMLRALI